MAIKRTKRRKSAPSALDDPRWLILNQTHRERLDDLRMRMEVIQQDFQRMVAMFDKHERMHREIEIRMGQLTYLSEHMGLRKELLKQFESPFAPAIPNGKT